jgi:hypothetical protein
VVVVLMADFFVGLTQNIDTKDDPPTSNRDSVDE